MDASDLYNSGNELSSVSVVYLSLNININININISTFNYIFHEAIWEISSWLNFDILTFLFVTFYRNNSL